MTHRPGIATKALIAGAAAFVVLAGFVFYSSAGRDDAHITYWAAHTLASSGEVTNYNGDAVEQSSSLLHVLLLGLVAAVTGVEPVTAGKWMGIVFGAVTVLLTSRLADRVAPLTGSSAAWLVATLPPVVYWSFGGLETTLASAAMLCAVLALAGWHADPRNRSRQAAVVAAVLALLAVRPEAPFVLLAGLATAAALGGAAAITRRHERASLLSSCARPAAAAAGVVLLALALGGARMLLFGQSLPQPVFAKATGLPVTRLLEGLTYIVLDTDWFFGAGVVFALALAAVVSAALHTELRSREPHPFRTYTLALLLAHGAFIVVTGGDWMEGSRFLVPILPLAAVLAAAHLTARPRGTRLAATVLLVVIAGNLAGNVLFAARSSTGTTLFAAPGLVFPYDSDQYSWFERRNRIHLREIPVIHHLEETLLRLPAEISPVRIMSGQMGMVAYHLTRRQGDRLEWMDRYSLTDRGFTSCPVSARIPRTRLGTDVSYSWFFQHADELERVCGLRRPDLIFDIDYRGRAAAEVERNGYRLVFVQTGTGADGGLLPGVPVNAEQFVAVRGDLLPPGDPPLVRVRYGDLIADR